MSKPAKTFRSGKNSVAIFRNQGVGKGPPFHSAKASTKYKKGDDWVYGDNFSSSDLCVVRELMALAIPWMIEADAKAASEFFADKNRSPSERGIAPATPKPDSGDVPPDDEVPF